MTNINFNGWPQSCICCTLAVLNEMISYIRQKGKVFKYMLRWLQNSSGVNLKKKKPLSLIQIRPSRLIGFSAGCVRKTRSLGRFKNSAHKCQDLSFWGTEKTDRNGTRQRDRQGQKQALTARRPTEGFWCPFVERMPVSAFITGVIKGKERGFV